MAVVVVLMRAIFRLVAPLVLAAGILSPASGLVVPGQSLDTSASALSSRVLVGLTGPGLADPEGLVPVLSSAFIPGDRPSAPVRSSREATAPSGIPGVRVPGGVAEQAADAASIAARAEVAGGARIWRVGTTGRSNAADAQFWSLEHPSLSGFADRYGTPAENVLNADFIESAVVPAGTPFVTRQAPGVGTNLGGGIEVVVPEGAVRMCSFSIVGGC